MEQLIAPSVDAAEESPSYCVFRRGSEWYALSAIVVREALVKPDLVFVPGTPKVFAGLCHVRSEFIPVLKLNAGEGESNPGREQVLLILDDLDGAWALLVDEVSSLRKLVISDAPEADLFDDSLAIVGWGTMEDTVVQVLDPSRIRQVAEDELQRFHQHSATPAVRQLDTTGPDLPQVDLE